MLRRKSTDAVLALGKGCFGGKGFSLVRVALLHAVEMALPLGEAFGGVGWKRKVSGSCEIALIPNMLKCEG